MKEIEKQKFIHCGLMLWNACLVLVLDVPLAVIPFAMSAYYGWKTLKTILVK
jgi:hypothetical protein